MLIATAASMSGFLLIVGKLSYGYCSDRIGPELTSVIFTVIACIGYGSIFMLLFIPQSFMLFIAYAGHGIGGSVCSLGYQLGTLIGSPIPGIIADAAGKYLDGLGRKGLFKSHCYGCGCIYPHNLGCRINGV